jgi:IMP dehydrogenase
MAGGTEVRDLVEIGMGRTARQAYELDDVEIVPSRRTRSSKIVSTAWQIDAYRFDIPLVTHPTDAIVSPDTAIAVGRLGGLGVLNSEGLWARHPNVKAALGSLVDAVDGGAEPAELTGILQALHAAPIQPDLITEALKQVRDAGVTVAARVSPQRASELTPALLSAGVEILVVQGTIVSAEHVGTEEEPLNLKHFISALDVPVIAGGVADYRTAMHLMRTGAAGVIVGHGHTAGVTSTDAVLGIGVPMATAIVDAAAARRDYLDETGGRYVHVIADGGVHVSGDLAKTIACGADAVMLGEPLATAAEMPGRGLYWTSAAAHPSLPRSRVAVGSLLDPVTGPDGDGHVDLRTLLFGPSRDADGRVNLFGALRRALAKTGYSDLKEFQKVGLTVRG